jgi:signal transduction histidine kinase
MRIRAKTESKPLDLSGIWFDRAPSPMAMVEGVAHTVCCVNAAFCRLTDKTSGELVGKAFRQILPKKMECVALLDRVLSTGKSETYTEQKSSEPHTGFSSYTMWSVIAKNLPTRVIIQVNEEIFLHEKTLAMNEALMLGSVRQHELTAASNTSNASLKVEISERKLAENALKQAQAQLKHHAERLEELVAERTSELTETNRRLEASVDFIKKGKEEYRLLLLESQIMQRKLSLLTRQIITAQEEERKEISRELHDGVVQTLVAINIQLSALSNGATATQKRKLARIQHLVKDSENEAHRFARELRPAVLDDLGLIPALHGYNNSLQERKQIKIKLTAVEGVEALGANERTVLFRVAQEALTNVVRHARATQVEMVISKSLGAIRMEIRDNGKSFSVEKTFLAKNPKRLGLVGMKERMEMVGGSLTIESTPGKGTTVRVQVPFSPEETLK